MIVSRYRPKYPWWCVALMLLTTTGCAMFGAFSDPPGIHLAGIRMLETQGLEAAFEIDLRVLNRSDAPLFIQGMDCELELNGKRFAEGVANVQKEIPAYSSDLVTVTVYTSMLDMVRVVHRLITSAADPDKLPVYTYGLRGRLHGEGGSFLRSIPFSSEGRFDMEEFAGSSP